MKIAVVIPTYKVSKHIKDVINNIPEIIDTIIVIDDKCPDNSGKIVEALNNDKVALVYHSQNQGVGGAVVSGYKKALELDMDIVVKIDGDGQMDINYLENLIQPIIDKKADYTKGNRFFFESDMLINLNIENAVVVDVPIPAKYGDEESSLNITRRLFSFPARLFNGMCKRLFQWVSSVINQVEAPIGTVILSVLPIILGTQFLLQAIQIDMYNIPRKEK